MGENEGSLSSSRAEIDTSLPFESVRAAVSLFKEKIDRSKPKFTEGELPKMGENEGSLSSSRAEIDTSLPFESVRAAVSLFKEKIDRNKPAFTELDLKQKRLSREAELLMAHQELAKVREQLTDTLREKERALYELAESRKLVEEMRKMEEGNISEFGAMDAIGLARPNTVAMQTGSIQAEEKHMVWKDQSKIAEGEQVTMISELDTTKKELAKMKQEFLACLNEREYAMKRGDEALAAAEINGNLIDDMISGTNKSLVLEKWACIEENKERVGLLATKEAGGGKGATIFPPKELDTLKQELVFVQQIESNLKATNKELVSIGAELATEKEAEVKFARATPETLSKLERVITEFQQTRSWELSSSVNSGATTEQEKPKRVIDDGASLKVVMEILQTELEATKEEMLTLRERETNATAAAIALNIELTKAKDELKAALAAEVKANKAISGLSQALEQVTAEAEAAKIEAGAMREEVHKAKTDTELAKSVMNFVESKLLADLKESDAAKAAETIAVWRMSDLSERTSAARASEVEAGAGVCISEYEYDLLNGKVQEAETLITMKTVIAIALVKAAKASEQELRQQLETLNEDMEDMKARIKQALHRAEMAEAAKSALDRELRRWREQEQRQKEREEILADQQPFMIDGDDEHSFSFPQAPQAESLAEVLNMKIPSQAGSKSTDSLFMQKKKSSLPSIGGFVKKKNKISSSSLSSRFT